MEPKRFWIYGEAACEKTEDARNVLSQLGHTVIFIPTDDRPEFRRPDWETLPQIYDGTVHVGGCEELQDYLNKPWEKAFAALTE